MKNVGEETTAKYFVRGKVDGWKERRKEGRKTTLYTLISNTKLVVEKTKNLICTTESSKGSEFQFNSVVADSMWPHALQHASLPCPSPIPRACSKSCSWSCWCHPTISSSVVPFSSCRQSFRTSRSFQMSQLFASGGQSIGVSASASILPVNIQDFRMDWMGTLKSLLQASILRCSALFVVRPSHPYVTTEKTVTLTRWIFVGKVMSLLFSMLPRLVIAFLPRSKHLLISWLQSPSAVILETKKIKYVTVSIVSPSVCHEMMGSDAMIFVFDPHSQRLSCTKWSRSRCFSGIPLLFVSDQRNVSNLKLKDTCSLEGKLWQT